MQECLDRLCLGVATSIVKGDVAGINEILKRLEPEALKLCRQCPFRIGILDKNGETLTVFPYKEEAMGNFSSYGAVAQTLKDHKVNQQRLFLQNGGQVYVICARLCRGKFGGDHGPEPECRRGQEEMGFDGAGVPGHQF